MTEPEILDAEIIVLENEIKDILNGGINVCCPKCHLQDYDFYPTGICEGYNEIWFRCKKCGEKWNSGFLPASESSK